VEGKAPAQPNAVGDPLKVIYRISGIADSGSAAGAGQATTIMCTNLSTVTETLSIVVRNFNGVVVVPNTNNPVSPNRTLTLSTHFTNMFFDDVVLSPGIVINQGSAIIRSTTTNMICSAMIVDAASAAGQGIGLHMVRVNPLAGSQE
jgi:hypothetical protein